MDNILQPPSRWKITGSFFIDMSLNIVWICAIGLFSYFFNQFGFVRKTVLINNTGEFIFLELGKVAFFVGLIITIFLLYSLLLAFLDILTSNCRIEKIKVLKIKRYLKFTSGNQMRYGMFLIGLCENGEIIKLKANDIDIEVEKTYDVAISNYLKRIVDFLPCDSASEDNIYNLYDNNNDTKHSVIYKILEFVGCVSECYSKGRIIFNLLVSIEILAYLGISTILLTNHV